MPRVVLIDEAVRQHVSQAYWDWRSLFDHDPCASPLQHADYVLAELDGARSSSTLEPVLLRAGTDRECSALGILIPKDIADAETLELGSLKELASG